MKKLLLAAMMAFGLGIGLASAYAATGAQSQPHHWSAGDGENYDTAGG